MSLSLQELAAQAPVELAKLVQRDKDKPISSMLVQWTWELSMHFRVPILVTVIPNFPGTSIIAIPLPAEVLSSLPRSPLPGKGTGDG